MIPIFTATNLRPEVLSVWCSALRATLRNEYVTHVYYVQPEPPTCGDSCSRIQEFFLASSLVCFESQMPQDGVRVFIEEDIIPVREWSLEDYPGDLLMLEGSPGQQWQSLAISRVPAHAHGQPLLIPQRFVRDGGCPAWMPSGLCELALAANAKIVGDHFLHIDKMHNRPPPKEIAEKNKLLSALASMFATMEAPQRRPGVRPCIVSEDGDFITVDETNPAYPHARPGLGDMVKAGLSAIGITEERVSKAIGRPCGCGKRAEQLNELGRKFGIG